MEFATILIGGMDMLEFDEQTLIEESKTLSGICKGNSVHLATFTGGDSNLIYIPDHKLQMIY